MLIGGCSVALHARPRYTKDIVFFILASTENAEKMQKVVDDFGFASLGISKDDFEKKGQIIQLGVEPKRIDLLNQIPGVEFDTVWKNRVKIKINNLEVNLISADELTGFNS